MSVHIGHATSDVIAEPEPTPTGTGGEPQPWEQLAQASAVRTTLARNARRTRAEGFDD